MNSIEHSRKEIARLEMEIRNLERWAIVAKVYSAIMLFVILGSFFV